MTCIVALRTDKHIIMGADSQTTSGYRKDHYAQSKVFQLGSMLVGCSGSVRFANLVRCGSAGESLAVLTPSGDPLEWMVKTFVPTLQGILRDCGHMERFNEKDQTTGIMLVAFGRSLLSIYQDLEVSELQDNYTAIGSGQDYALGSLYSTPQIEPRKRVRMAVQAACCHDIYCSGQCRIKSLRIVA